MVIVVHVVGLVFVELMMIVVEVDVDVDDCILDHEHVELVVVEKLFGFELVNFVVVVAVVAVVEVLLVVLVDSSYHQTLTSIHQDSNLPKDFVVVVAEMKLLDYFVLVAVQ